MRRHFIIEYLCFAEAGIFISSHSKTEKFIICRCPPASVNCFILVAGAYTSGIAPGPRLGGNFQGRGEGGYLQVP